MTYSPVDAAKLMFLKIEERNGELLHADALSDIRERFGDTFTHENESGNQAIDPRVLKEFKKLTGPDVVWSRSGRYWRRREHYDSDSRSQP